MICINFISLELWVRLLLTFFYSFCSGARDLQYVTWNRKERITWEFPIEEVCFVSQTLDNFLNMYYLFSLLFMFGTLINMLSYRVWSLIVIWTWMNMVHCIFDVTSWWFSTCVWWQCSISCLYVLSMFYTSIFFLYVGRHFDWSFGMVNVP